MPNGDPHFAEETLPGLEAFFSKLAPQLEGFASRHNLQIGKYYHQSHSWSLRFRHPHGGVAKIEVEKHSDTTVQLFASWWHDDYDKATRSIKRLATGPLDTSFSVLERALESTLATVVSWEFGSWDSIHGGFVNWHKTMTKAQFEALDLEYPQLKK